MYPKLMLKTVLQKRCMNFSENFLEKIKLTFPREKHKENAKNRPNNRLNTLHDEEPIKYSLKNPSILSGMEKQAITKSVFVQGLKRMYP